MGATGVTVIFVSAFIIALTYVGFKRYIDFQKNLKIMDINLKALQEKVTNIPGSPAKVQFQPASTLASAQPFASYAAMSSVAYYASGAITPPASIMFLHPNEAVNKKTKEDIVDEGFIRVRKYITNAEELDRGHLQHLIENLRWTTDHVIGTSGPETEGALDMNLFAKLSSELIEESEKILSLDTVSKSQLRSIQLRLEGLFEFLKRYPDETPRRKEVEDALLIVDDFMHTTKTEAGK